VLVAIFRPWLVRTRASRARLPRSPVISNSAISFPKATTGLDVNKRTPGRKRGLAVDVLGLIIGVVVLAASAHEDRASGRPTRCSGQSGRSHP
jgi:hypothetical protein